MAAIPPETATELQKLEQLHSEHPEGRYFVPLADRYRRLGMVEEAERLLRDGLERHPDYLSAHVVLGGCLADRGAPEAAVEEFQYVLGTDPQNLIALRSLGEIALARGDEAEAERWYRELLAVDPMNKDARAALETLAEAGAAPEGDSGNGLDEALLLDAAGDELATPEPERDGGAWQQDADDSYDFSWGEVRLDSTADGAATESVDAADDLAWLDDISVAEQETASRAAQPGSAGDEPAEDGELITETIAELYARQGFHDRSAEVYRELIRQRGGDPELEARLEVEERALRGEVPEAPEAALDDADAAFAQSFADGFPAADGSALPMDPPGEPEFDSFAALDLLDDFAPEQPEAGEDVAAASPASDAHANGEQTAPEPRRGIRAALRELIAWRPAAPPATIAAEPPESYAGPEEEDTDLSWLADILSEESQGEPAPAPLNEQPISPETGTGAEPASALELGGDEDLESFQAWLQSLKR